MVLRRDVHFLPVEVCLDADAQPILAEIRPLNHLRAVNVARWLQHSPTYPRLKLETLQKRVDSCVGVPLNCRILIPCTVASPGPLLDHLTLALMAEECLELPLLTLNTPHVSHRCRAMRVRHQ